MGRDSDIVGIAQNHIPKEMKRLTALVLMLTIVSAPVSSVEAPTATPTQRTIIYSAPDQETLSTSLSRERTPRPVFTVTAYDLSVQSCGKSESHPEYGITASGLDLDNKAFPDTRVVAVDPDVIPLGSHLSVEFIDINYSKYNGIYTACDTGSAINGEDLDIYIGEDMMQECLDFGITQSYVEILN